MTGDAIDQAKWRVIAAQALREDIDRELTKLLDVAAVADQELLAANERLASLTDGADGPSSVPPTRLALLRSAVEDSKPLTGILRSAVEKVSA